MSKFQPQSVLIDTFTIPAKDGFPLVATRFVPLQSTTTTSTTSAPVVIIQSALGTSRSFYIAFARFLVDSGIPAVFTYDVRGHGDSILPTPTNFRAKLEDHFEFVKKNKDITILDHWAFRDQVGVVKYAHESYPDRELVIVGNSLGGQIAPAAMIDEAGTPRVTRCIFISSSSAYWGNFPNPLGFRIMGHLILPNLSWMLGYFPAQMIQMAEGPLPLGVAQEWLWATRYPGYLCAVSKRMNAAYKSAKGKVLSLSFEDDHLVKKEAFRLLFDEMGGGVDSRWRHFKILPESEAAEVNADTISKVEKEARLQGLIDQGVVGGSVGHLMFFKEKTGRRLGLWDAVLGYILHGEFPKWAEKIPPRSKL
ncbi:Alpha/Beta hydrolase protein [Cladochytrium replicatum]|nr:Alpha/Beta hydrolase protein [Cladochytrium replicatum]